MNLVLLIVVLFLVFGLGGGWWGLNQGYYAGSAFGGISLGTILIIVLIIILLR